MSIAVVPRCFRDLAVLAAKTEKADRAAVRPCKYRHAHHIKMGHRFCPDCGRRLKVIQVCKTCGSNFNSAPAWRKHVIIAHKKKQRKRPKCCGFCEASARNLHFLGHGATRSIYRCTICGNRMEIGTT